MKPRMRPLFPEEDLESLVIASPSICDKTIRELTALYDTTDWRCVRLDGSIDREYRGMLTISLFKALALPFLVDIRGERPLSREINSREPLRQLCGFHPDNMPKERTFWHFRKKYEEVYSEVMLKVLISLVLSGRRPKLSLPFVKTIDEDDRAFTGDAVELTLDHYRPPVRVTRPEDRPENLRSLLSDEEAELKGKDVAEWRRILKQYSSVFTGSRNQDKGFVGELDLPVEVSTVLVAGRKVCFRIVAPCWLSKQPGRKSQEVHRERLVSSSLASGFDKACNILLIRTEKGEQQILLSRRIDDGYGSGTFAAPGGKQKSDETLEGCAVRELMEETSIRLVRSRPVSLFYTRKDPQDPARMIMSVGVLAEEWYGEPRTQEPDSHAGWEWHKLSELPEQLFEPTAIAVEQYKEETYPGLHWEDVEEKPREQLSLFKDLLAGGGGTDEEESEQ